MTGPSELRKILLIDDNLQLAENLREILEEFGLQVDVATDGYEGLRALEREPYHLTVTDMRMPGIDGLQLVRAARARWPKMPIVVMTAFIQDDAVDHVLEDGALEVVRKPMDPSAFVEIVLRLARAKTHVLVVEDDASLRTNLVHLLLDIDDLVPQPARTRSEASRIIAQVEPSFAIIDWILPDGCGAALAGEMQTCAKTMAMLPNILIITGHPDAVDLGPCGADHRTCLLPKPFQVDDLRHHLIEFLACG